MSTVGQPERATQNRVIALFRDELHYRYLGDWTYRDKNSSIEETLLTAYLSKIGYTPPQISAAIHDLRTEANHHDRNHRCPVRPTVRADGRDRYGDVQPRR